METSGSELDRVAEAGGNSVRVWVHVEGDSSPYWDSDGFTLGTDEAGTLVQDLKAFLDECQERGIFMGLVLFNGALMRNQNTINLFWDESKLQRYIDNALTPMVEGLRNHPALGFWEVMNEAEGSMIPGEQNDEPCFDLTHLDWTKEAGGSGGPGWTGVYLPLQGVLRLHNWISAAINTLDPKALVTTGSWSPLASTNLAGDDPGGATTEDLVEYLYTKGFAGGLSWALIPTGSEASPEVEEDVLKGIKHLQGRTDHGNIEVTIS